MKKFGIKSLLAVVLILVLAFSLVACVKPCEQHVDEDGNKVCDTCKEEFTCKHVDKNKDGKCDKCKAPYTAGGGNNSGDTAAFFQGLWDSAAPIGGTEITDEEDLAVEMDMSIALANGSDMLADLGVKIALVLDRTNAGAHSAAKIGLYDHDNNVNIATIYYFLDDNMNFYIEALGQSIVVPVDYNYNNDVAPMLNGLLNTTFKDLLGEEAVAGLPLIAQETIMGIINNLVEDFGANWNLDKPINAVTGLLGINIGELLGSPDIAMYLDMANSMFAGLAEDMDIEYKEIDPDALAESDTAILDLLMSVGPVIFPNVTVDGNKQTAGLDFAAGGLIDTVLGLVGTMIELPMGLGEVLTSLNELSLEYTVEDGQLGSFGMNVGLDTNEDPFRVSIRVNDMAIKGVDAAEAATVFGVNKANFKENFEINTALNIEISEGALVVAVGDNVQDFAGTYEMALRGQIDFINETNNGTRVYASIKHNSAEIARLTFDGSNLALSVDGSSDIVAFIVEEGVSLLLKSLANATTVTGEPDEWLQGLVLTVANAAYAESFDDADALVNATSFTINPALTMSNGVAITDITLADIKLHGTQILGDLAGVIMGYLGGSESAAEGDSTLDEVLEAVWQPDLMTLLTAISEVVNGEFGTDGLEVDIDDIGEFMTDLFDSPNAVGPTSLQELCYGNPAKNLVGLFTMADSEDWNAKEWATATFGQSDWVGSDIFMDLMSTGIKAEIKSDLTGSIELSNGSDYIKVSFSAGLVSSDSAIDWSDVTFPEITNFATYQLV